MAADPRKTLWENLETLMKRDWGGVNKSRLSRAAAIGTNTVKRVAAADDSVGLDIIKRLAGLFRVPVWRLLKPGILETGDRELSDEAVELGQLFDKLPAARQPRAYALMVQLLEFENEGPTWTIPSQTPSPSPAPAPRESRARVRKQLEQVLRALKDEDWPQT